MSSGVRVIIQKAGGVSAITTEPMQAPPPKEGEVRIKVAYAGINFADLLMRLGFYQPRPPFPFTPGYEVSGVVDALGKGVTGLEVGQKVVAAMQTVARPVSFSRRLTASSLCPKVFPFKPQPPHRSPT